MKTIKLNLEQAAAQFGASKETLRRGLRRLDIATTKGTRHSLADIYRALSGDLHAERTRETRARADLLELERREKERDLVSLAEVQTLMRDILLPVRQRLLALPSEAATRVNPTDPQMARDALQAWVDAALPAIRKGMPK